MASVEVTISGVLYDKVNRTMQNVVLIGDATLTGLGIGGGPIVPPPDGGTKPPSPPGHPAHPIWGLPVDPGYGIPGPPYGPGKPPLPPGTIWPNPPEGTAPLPEHPIVLPPEQVPPGVTLPPPPQPGDPTVPVPPPEGSGGWPVRPIVPPPYIVVNYPGIGPVMVAPPAPTAPTPTTPAPV